MTETERRYASGKAPLGRSKWGLPLPKRAAAPSGRRRTKRKVAQSAGRWLLPFVGLAIVAAIWEITGRFIITDRLLFSPMSTTFVTLYHMLRSGAILPDLRVSAVEFALGYLVAAVVGISMGAWFAASSTAHRMFSATIQAGYATPIIALAPLITVILGIGIRSKVVVIASLAVFPILIGTEGALRSIDPEFIETGRAFGANRLQMLRKIIFPAAAGGVLTGLRLGVGRGIIGCVVAEFFGSTQGLGHLMLYYSDSFQTSKALAVVVLLAAIGVFSNSILLAVERRVTPWSRGPSA